MANTVNLNVNVTINNTSAGRKAYDNRTVREDEVLVPMVVTDDLINLYEMDRHNIRTWQMGGRTFMVAFYPVPAAEEKIAMSQYYTQVNELLGERRDARCLIPQPDGTFKVCPKKNGDNRCSCTNCPDKTEYEREDKALASLDKLYESYDYEVGEVSSFEETLILADSLNTLLQHLEEKEPRYAKIIKLIIADYTPGEIIDIIKLNKSRGYQEIKNAQKLAKELYYKN